MANNAHDGEVTLARLREILAAYGASPRRWPADERDGAETLLASSLKAREAVTEAARLDGVLDHDPAPAPSPELAGRIHRFDITQAAPGIWLRLGHWLNDSYAAIAFRPVALPAAVVVATLVGLTVGFALPHPGGLTASLPGAVVVAEAEPGIDDEVFGAEATAAQDMDVVADFWAGNVPLAEAPIEPDGAAILDEFPTI